MPKDNKKEPKNRLLVALKFLGMDSKEDSSRKSVESSDMDMISKLSKGKR